MANDIGVYSLNAVAPVSRKDSAPSIKELQADPVSQASSDEGLVVASLSQAERPNRADLEQSVDELNGLVQELHRELHFSLDDGSGEVVVKVIDRETDEILREIPSEEVLRLREKLEEATGAIFSDRV